MEPHHEKQPDPLDEDRSPTDPKAAEAAEEVVPQAFERAARGESPHGSADDD